MAGTERYDASTERTFALYCVVSLGVTLYRNSLAGKHIYCVMCTDSLWHILEDLDQIVWFVSEDPSLLHLPNSHMQQQRAR